jgi:tetratricopeptide (TPR) repeat protein
MTEDEYIDAICTLLPSDQDEFSCDVELLRLSEEAVTAFPTSSELWTLRGTAIEACNHPLNEARLASDPCPTPLETALECWNRALSIDPCCVDALEAIGFFYDVYADDFEAAERSFRAAIALGGSADCYAGLARVLQETGRTDEAKALLSPESCPFHAEAVVAKMREEIAAELWAPLET